jgi:hypothetical protein
MRAARSKARRVIEQGTQTFQSVRPAEFYSADRAMWSGLPRQRFKKPLGAQSEARVPSGREVHAGSVRSLGEKRKDHCGHKPKACFHSEHGKNFCRRNAPLCCLRFRTSKSYRI